jgi:hypothetical protein
MPSATFIRFPCSGPVDRRLNGGAALHHLSLIDGWYFSFTPSYSREADRVAIDKIPYIGLIVIPGLTRGSTGSPHSGCRLYGMPPCLNGAGAARAWQEKLFGCPTILKICKGFAFVLQVEKSLLRKLEPIHNQHNLNQS